MSRATCAARLVASLAMIGFSSLARAALLACLVACGSGCLFDSSYWQRKAAQRNVAQQRTPSALAATPAKAPADDARAHGGSHASVLRLRVHATPSYAAEVVDWPRQFARLIEDTNRVLEPTLDVRFEIAETRTWATSLSDDSLEALLGELAVRDP